MAMLEVPGTFTMLVPDGWRASRSDGTYELLKDGHDGAVHLSAYDRNGSPLRDDEARGILDAFIASTGTSESPEVTVMLEGAGQQRARASFGSAGEGGAQDWLVFVVLWPERFVLCSCTAPVGSALPTEAEQMFATIFPPKAKRGFLGRRR